MKNITGSDNTRTIRLLSLIPPVYVPMPSVLVTEVDSASIINKPMIALTMVANVDTRIALI
jgi:hypothetical protein